MRALAIVPGKKNSMRLIERPRPTTRPGSLICRMRAVGVCGTDRELLNGDYGSAPDGEEFLIIGHESFGHVVESADPAFAPGDPVVGIVRRPDPVPCRSCAAGEWDMCENGLFTERGISKRHGFCSDYFQLDARFAVKVDPSLGDLAVLLEPCSIVAKAWEQCERLLARAVFKPKRVLITGAGPVGLLAAMIGTQKGYEVHVLDRMTDGAKPAAARALGAAYHPSLEDAGTGGRGFDLTIECTGAPALVAKLMTMIAPDGILCLTGVSSGGREIGFDIGALNRGIVLENEIIFGSVNANRRHFEAAAQALRRADRDWLSRLITRRVRLEDWPRAFERRDTDIKVVIEGEAADV